MHIRIPYLATSLILITSLSTFSPLTSAEIFEGVPDLIVCEIEIPLEGRRGRRVFYLDAQEDGGVTRYTSLGAAPMQLRVDADGSVRQGNLSDCAGRTVAELRQTDQAFDVE